jgi:hypothetical protein
MCEPDATLAIWPRLARYFLGMLEKPRRRDGTNAIERGAERLRTNEHRPSASCEIDPCVLVSLSSVRESRSKPARFAQWSFR